MKIYDAYEGEAAEIIKTLSPRAKRILTELYLEDKKASLECLRDFQAVERGEMTPDEFIQRTIDRDES